MPTKPNPNLFNYKRSKFYSRTGHSNNLLKPGYGGALDDDEIKAIKSELERLPRLKTIWGFTESEHITNKKIQERAMYIEEEQVEEDVSSSPKKRKPKKKG